MGGSIGQGRACGGAWRIEGVRLPAGYCETSSVFRLSGAPMEADGAGVSRVSATARVHGVRTAAWPNAWRGRFGYAWQRRCSLTFVHG